MPKQRLRVLVTGGAGFIGSHVVDELVNRGYYVRVIDNLCSGNLANIYDHLKAGEVDFIEGDIRDPYFVWKSVQDISIVFHLAALTSVPFSVQNPELTYETNVEGTMKLLDACVESGVKKIVFVSSCAVYGDPQHLPIDEKHPTRPLSPYAVTKLEGEKLFKNYEKQHGLQTVILRLFNVYGPRQGLNEYSGVITQFMDRVKKDLPIITYGDGNQTRDFVHVWDAADAVFDALNCRNAVGEVFNIGFGKATTVNDLAMSVLDLYGSDVDIIHEKPRTGEIRDSCANISKAKKILGYVPKVSLEPGLRSLGEDDEPHSDKFLF